jgi:hypothetical protein
MDLYKKIDETVGAPAATAQPTAEKKTVVSVGGLWTFSDGSGIVNSSLFNTLSFDAALGQYSVMVPVKKTTDEIAF